VQFEALIALEHIAGGAVRRPELVKLLESPQQALYTGAIDALGSIGMMPGSRPLLVKRLKGTTRASPFPRAWRWRGSSLRQRRAETGGAVLSKRSREQSAGSQRRRRRAGFVRPGRRAALMDLVKGHAANPDQASQLRQRWDLCGPARRPPRRR